MPVCKHCQQIYLSFDAARATFLTGKTTKSFKSMTSFPFMEANDTDSQVPIKCRHEARLDPINDSIPKKNGMNPRIKECGSKCKKHVKVQKHFVKGKKKKNETSNKKVNKSDKTGNKINQVHEKFKTSNTWKSFCVKV